MASPATISDSDPSAAAAAASTAALDVPGWALFGSRQGDQRRFFWPHGSQLLAVWHSPRHVFLVINRSELEPLRSHMQPPPREVAAAGKMVIVVNFETHDQPH